MIWNTWVTEIKAVIPETQFVDEQRAAPINSGITYTNLNQQTREPNQGPG